jgi:protein-disulfide isomerase
MSARLVPPVDSGDHRLGPDDASVTLVEFGDFECPHCGAAYPIVRRVLSRLGGRVRFVFRNFPLSRSHPHAEHAAEMAEAAAAKGRFWEMHSLLFENQDALEDDDLVFYAGSLGIDEAWAREALASGAFSERVRDQFMSGVRSGVNGTPTFFLNGIRHDGPWDEESLTELLERQLAAAGRR